MDVSGGIHKQIYELCLEIEKLPASEQQTRISVLATALHSDVDATVAQAVQVESAMSQHCPGCRGQITNHQHPGPCVTSCPGCGHEAELALLWAVAAAAREETNEPYIGLRRSLAAAKLRDALAAWEKNK